MLWRNSILPLAVAALLAAPAAAQVKLDRKIQEGKAVRVNTVTRLSQKLTIAGMDVDTSSNTQSTVIETTGKREENGKIKAQEKIDSLQVQIKVMGSEYLFDSKNPDKEGTSILEGIRKVHQVLSRSVTTKTFDKDNKLVGVEFEEDPLNGLDDATKGLIKDQLDPEKQKESANAESERIPSSPVNKGDTWDHTTKANLGSGQVMTFVSKYTYEGEVEKNGKKLDKISSIVKSVELTIEDAPSPVKLKKSEIKPTESKEVILFDRQRGEVVETTSEITIKGDLVLVVNGTELPSKLDLKIETNTTRE